MIKRYTRQVSTDNVPEELINHLAKISGLSPSEIQLTINEIQNQKLEIKQIINPFFDNLTQNRTKDNEKKTSELIDLGKFLYKMNIGNEVKIIECGEKPDFVIKYQGELIGVEHTGMYDDKVVAEIMTLKKILNKAQDQIKNDKKDITGLFNVIVVPSKLNERLDRDQNKLTQLICSFVIDSYYKKETEKPDFIDDLVYTPNPGFELTLGEDYWLSELTTESIATVISKKEGKLNSYKLNRNLNKYWLLIVIGGASSASSFRMSLDKLPTRLTQFDKVYIFENFKGTIIESIKS